MKEEKFENIRQQVFRWFLNKNVLIHLEGFKYVTYILTKKLMGRNSIQKLQNIF